MLSPSQVSNGPIVSNHPLLGDLPIGPDLSPITLSPFPFPCSPKAIEGRTGNPRERGPDIWEVYLTRNRMPG